MPSDEVGISESEGTDTSLSDPLDEVRDTAHRAFSVANNALNSRKPAIAIVLDPESGIPVLVNVSPEWASATHVPLEEGRRSICKTGVFPPAMHFMDRNSALQLSAAMGSAEAANELISESHEDKKSGVKQDEDHFSKGGAASTAISKKPAADSNALATRCRGP